MKKIFFVACLFNLVFSLKSQSSLGIDTNPGSYSIPGSACSNDSKPFLVTIKNYGPQACIGPIDLVIGIDSTANGSSITGILMVDSFSVNIPVSGLLPDSTT